MKKENSVRTHEKSLKRMDLSLEEIYRKLYSLDVLDGELGSIGIKLNELFKENELLKEAVDKDINMTVKHSHKLYLAYAGLALLVLGSSFVNYGLAIILLFAELGMIIKNVGSTTLSDLEAIKESADFQNYRIIRYKKNTASRIKMRKKEIDDSEIFGMNFNEAYERALECTRLLLAGDNVTIENTLVKGIVKELLKDERFPNASIEELVELKRSNMSKGMVLEKNLD